MKTSEIKNQLFQNNLCISEIEFTAGINFRELKSWCFTHRNEGDENIYIGIVNNRFLWYKEQDGKIYCDEWGFLDEIGLSE